jgi:hypothetical protein
LRLGQIARQWHHGEAADISNGDYIQLIDGYTHELGLLSLSPFAHVANGGTKVDIRNIVVIGSKQFCMTGVSRGKTLEEAKRCARPAACRTPVARVSAGSDCFDYHFVGVG